MSRGRPLHVAAAALVVACLGVGSSHGAEPASVALQIEDDGVVLVTGLEPTTNGVGAESERGSKAGIASRADVEAWKRVLRVVARDPQRALATSELPALLGRYQLADGVLRFTPKYPPLPGLVVEAVFDPGAWAVLTGGRASGSPRVVEHRIPEPRDRPATSVVGVQPGGPTVPANLLRWYIQFSAPMSVRQVLPHVRLLDDRGTEIETAFVEVEGGLWDPARTRLTLFVHPGRIKRGVGPHQALGPVLEAGETYRLRIDAQARDGHGRPLAATFEHRFTAGPEDHEPPDPTRWAVTPPSAMDDPLRVMLDAPADHALLERVLAIVDAEERVVAGRFEVTPDGRRLTFTPDGSWPSGEYRLVVPTWLEDLSGNRIDRRFEAAATVGADPRSSEPICVPFRID